MEYTVILESKPGHYLASVPTLPDCVGKGRTREEALQNVRAEIVDRLQRVEITRIEVEVPSAPDPWEPFIGMWAEDSTWDEFQAEIAVYRQKTDAELADE